MTAPKKITRVDLIILRFRDLQDLDLTKVRYRTDILGLMCGCSDKELEELFRIQPLLRDFK